MMIIGSKAMPGCLEQKGEYKPCAHAIPHESFYDYGGSQCQRDAVIMKHDKETNEIIECSKDDPSPNVFLTGLKICKCVPVVA